MMPRCRFASQPRLTCVGLGRLVLFVLLGCLGCSFYLPILTPCWAVATTRPPSLPPSNLPTTPAQQATLEAKGVVPIVLKPQLPPQQLVAFEAWFQQLPLNEQATLQQQAEEIALLQQALLGLLGDDAPEALGDLTLLWQEAVQRSDTINYALEKLARKEEPNKAKTEKDLQTRRLMNGMAQIGGAAASLVTASPVGLMSGSFMGELLSSTAPDAKKRLNDADMVILAKAIDELQRRVFDTYYQWRQTQQRLALLNDHVRTLQQVQAQALKQAPLTEVATLQRSTTHVLQGLEREHLQLEQQLLQHRQHMQALAGMEVLSKLSLNKQAGS
ncbi:MAG: hypothetical protein ACKO34_05090 [Vampirovibrionales bacterium]